MPNRPRPDSASIVLLVIKEPGELVPKVPLVYDPKRTLLYPGQKPYYKLPGGKFDPLLDRNPMDNATRELWEETGIGNIIARDLREVWSFEKSSRRGGTHRVHIFVGCINRKLILFEPVTGEKMRFFAWDELTTHRDILNTHKEYVKNELIRRAVTNCSMRDYLPDVAM